MTLKVAIAKRINELLSKNNMTQYELYKRSGVPQSTISTILNAEIKTVRLSTLYDICSGLNIELSVFFDCDYLKMENLED